MWKNIAAIITIVIGLFTLSHFIATADDLKQLEIKTVQTLDQFQGEMDKRWDIYRYDDYTNQIMKLKQYLRDHPNDTEAKQDLEHIQQERELLRNKLNK